MKFKYKAGCPVLSTWPHYACCILLWLNKDHSRSSANICEAIAASFSDSLQAWCGQGWSCEWTSLSKAVCEVYSLVRICRWKAPLLAISLSEYVSALHFRNTSCSNTHKVHGAGPHQSWQQWNKNERPHTPGYPKTWFKYLALFETMKLEIQPAWS